MSYDVYELSSQLGRPVELYTFTEGVTKRYYTSAEDEVTFGGHVFLPRQIDRNVPKFSSDAKARPQLEITIPAEDPIASRYIGIVPALRLDVEILRFHRPDSVNGWIEWQGRIVSAKFEQGGSVCRLFSVASESKLARTAPHYKYHSLCNHVLFDAACKASRSAHKFTVAVSEAEGRNITVPGVSLHGPSWALGGTVVLGDEARPVVGQTGDILLLSMPFYEVVVGREVDVYAGCDHTLATCNSKFSNALNFGGFAYVPTKNPFRTGI